jgi:hypothetical protein
VIIKIDKKNIRYMLINYNIFIILKMSLFVLLMLCSLINGFMIIHQTTDQYEFLKYDDALYRVIGLDDNNRIVNDCSFPCYDHNCSDVAIQATKCPNATWIAFIASSIECTFFNNWSRKDINYTVFAVDQDRNIDINSIETIPVYFAGAINYGCGLLTLWPNAMWFGMTLDFY